ncbi:hypothetical protein [Pyxidicoccus trucidator]|uniref:hypothetical protein n=1 Tax=Pyxidicoccus trucidator TaxID=2709662 RepID=UPI0013D95B27|nr:hypothetical protein [Pyxidicoccus trucidator]
MRLRLFVVAVPVLMAVGCGGTSSHTVKDVGADYRLSEHPEQGLVIVSTRFSTDCKNGENPSAALEYEDSVYMRRSTGVIPVNDLHLAHDFQAPPGHFSVKALNEGAYQIRRLSIGHIMPITKETRTPFEVEAGTAIYLGEVHFKLTNCGPFPSITTQVTDQWERDSQLLQQKMKNIRAEEVVKRLISTRTGKR